MPTLEISFSGPQGTRHFYLWSPDDINAFVVGSAGVLAISGSGTADPYARVLRYTDTPEWPQQTGGWVDTTLHGTAKYPPGTFNPWDRYPIFYIQGQELWATLYWTSYSDPMTAHPFEHNFGIFMGEQAIPEPLPAGLLLVGIIFLRISC